MPPEFYTELFSVISDAIKILGPALITAFVGYKAGKAQLTLKLSEIEKNNEFKARDRIFEFQKSRLEKLEESITSLSESLGKVAGMSSVDLDDNLKFSSFINKYVSIYVEDLPYQLDQIQHDFGKYSEEYPKYAKRLNKYVEEADDLIEPHSPDQVNGTVIKLIKIFTFASQCQKIIMEKQTTEVFSSYLGSAQQSA